MVEPSSVDGSVTDSDTIKLGDRGLSEETGQEGTDHTSHTVRGEDVESLVDVEQELELGGKVGTDGSEETNSDGSWSTNVTRSRGDTNKTGDGTGAETDSGELFLESPVEQHPGDGTDRSGEVGNDTGLNSSEVGRESRSTVEAEPSEPEEHRAEDDVGGVVGLVGESLGTVSSSFTKVDGDSKGGSSRVDVDGCSSGEIETTEDERPTVRVPGPACDGAVDDGEPDEEEDHDGANLGSLGKATNREDSGDELEVVSGEPSRFGRTTHTEHALVGAEEQSWNSRRTDRWVSEHALEAEVLQVTNVRRSGL